MKTEFNHAANNSPRSGSTKKVTPMVWAVMVAVMVAFAVWFSAYA
jgi:capsule polysaccharide export protein KpsE/RkpR